MKVTAIFGPPGTGKTRELVKMATGKRGVAMFSFTKAAALETASRLLDSSDVKASTIHSMVFGLMGTNRAQVVDAKKIKEFGKITGIPFKGVDDTDSIQEGDEYMSVLSYTNNRQIDLWAAYGHFGCPGTRHRFELFVQEYRQWKATYGYVDFDDMLIGFLQEYDSDLPNWKHVFLDEAQDCSPLQWMVFNKLCAGVPDVVIAGDDDQAIYEWNGADPHGMLDFLRAHEGEMVVLSQSHRIPRVVHDFVHNGILPKISRRVDKAFKPRSEGGMLEQWGDISDVNFAKLDDIGGTMVLARDRWRLDEIKRMLNREMIPYGVLGGHSPWTSKIAQQIRKGEGVQWDSGNVHWREFYRQADLSRPVNITLSTIHQAKGREADAVVLDLTLPARTLEAMYNDRDAELRVMYVALTRAKHNLILCGENPLI